MGHYGDIPFYVAWNASVGVLARRCGRRTSSRLVSRAVGGWRALQSGANQSRSRSAAFLIHYRPNAGRAADMVLETAVRALVALLTPVVGHHPKVQMNKPGGTGPTRGCTASRAIEKLLKGIEPTLYPPAVLNMIRKVERQPEPTEDPMAVLLCSNPIVTLEATLLPGRAEAIARLRADPINGFA